MRFILTLLTLMGTAWELAAQEKSSFKLDPDLPYQARRANPIKYAVDFSVVVTPPYHTKKLRIWLPLPQSDRGQEVSESELSTFPMTVKPRIAVEPLYGNKFAYFEFDCPEGAQIIRHQCKIKIYELHWEIDAAKVMKIDHWPAGFERYLRGESQAVVVNGEIRETAQHVISERRGAVQDLTQVMTWVSAEMKYDHDAASLRASSEQALANRKGHCSDYHGLCAALGRALGYPTRITYGINAFPKNSPSHCKMEAYLPLYGWVSFDVSETQLLIESIKNDKNLDAARKDKLVKAAGKRLAAGFRDNTWYLQTRGSDYDFAPAATKKVAVVRTIYAEADGVALPEPDPANKAKREWSWMTVHKYTPDRVVPYAFRDWKTLKLEN